MHFSTEVMISI